MHYFVVYIEDNRTYSVGYFFFLRLLVGSLLTEASILMPYWREMDPEAFLNLPGSLEPKLYRYFAPLTILATVFPVLAAIPPVILGATTFNFLIVPAIITLVMLFIYIVYFKSANKILKLVLWALMVCPKNWKNGLHGIG